MISLAVERIASLVSESDGFNPFQFAQGATFWTWVIFLGSLYPMWKFVFGPITNALAVRDQRVVDAAAAAEAARRAAEAAVAKAHDELELARVEGRRTVSEAVGRAERQAQEAMRAQKAETERQVEKAREEIEAEKRRALLEIRQEVVDLAIASAGRILRHECDDKAQRDLVQGFLDDIERRRN